MLSLHNDKYTSENLKLCYKHFKGKKIFKSAQVFFFREGTWRVQSLLNDDGIFFTAGFSNFSVISCLSKLVIQQVILQKNLGKFSQQIP